MTEMRLSDVAPPAMAAPAPGGRRACAAASPSAASERLNAECFCVGLDDDALRAAIEAASPQPGFLALLQERCPYAFAAHPVFVSARQSARMTALVGVAAGVLSKK